MGGKDQEKLHLSHGHHIRLSELCIFAVACFPTRVAESQAAGPCNNPAVDVAK